MMSNKNSFGIDHPALAELQKAQSIFVDAIDKTARKNLESTEQLLELNKKRFSATQDFSNPTDFMAQQTAVFKDYADHLKSHMEALASIGSESRDQLSEVSSEFARAMDFSSLFPFAENTGKTKAKPASKNS